MSWSRAASLVPSLLAAVSSTAVGGCAPAAAFRPMTLGLEEPNEFGVGLAYGAMGIHGRDACEGGDLPDSCAPGLNGQVWYQHRVSRWYTVGGTAYGGMSTWGGLGLQNRLHWVEGDRFRLGTDLDLGWFWAAVGVPMAYRLGDGFWLYSNPSFGFRAFQPARIPLGAAWMAEDGVWLHGEAAWGVDLVSPLMGSTRPPGQHWTASVAMSWQY